MTGQLTNLQHERRMLHIPTILLPSPADRPDSDVVVYDGECQFCRNSVNRLHRLDGKGRLSFLSLHDPLTRELCPNLTHEQMMAQMYVIERPSGRQHGGAAAIRYLSRHMPRLWPLVPVLHMPFCMPIWEWLYRQVAIRRYRWNKNECDSGTCKIHYR